MQLQESFAFRAFFPTQSTRYGFIESRKKSCSKPFLGLLSRAHRWADKVVPWSQALRALYMLFRIVSRHLDPYIPKASTPMVIADCYYAVIVGPLAHLETALSVSFYGELGRK